jgi:hypothetical protein
MPVVAFLKVFVGKIHLIRRMSSGSGKMRAIVVRNFGAPEVLGLEENVPIPKPNSNQVNDYVCLLKHLL